MNVGNVIKSAKICTERKTCEGCSFKGRAFCVEALVKEMLLALERKKKKGEFNESEIIG